MQKFIKGVLGGLFLAAINFLIIVLITIYIEYYHGVFFRTLPVIGIFFSITFFIIGYRYFSKFEIPSIKSKANNLSTTIKLYIVTIILYEFIIHIIIYNFRLSKYLPLRNFEQWFTRFEGHWAYTILPPIVFFVAIKMYQWALSK